MLENINLTFHMFWEALTEGRFLELLRQYIFLDRTAIPAEMDLIKIQFDKNSLEAEFQFLELRMDELDSKKWKFAVPSRRIKAYRNLRKGFRGFAVAQNSTIIGDVWCVVTDGTGCVVKHPDLEMLGIECEHGDAYGFDMVIAPDYRGKKLAGPLQRYFQRTLKLEGFTKLYGFYWEDNLPAMGMHQSLNYRELPKRRVSRIFWYKRFDHVSL